ncbi:hypothetical protein JTB14_027305 [Gonioctena quinquepunctata]|nr:hypothetical protein JTB14_027305 [Gonioctena quinquepunctata]
MVLKCQGREAVLDYGTDFGDGWRERLTLAFRKQEGEGLSGGAEQPRRPQSNWKEEYLPNPITQQERSLISQDLLVFKFG